MRKRAPASVCPLKKLKSAKLSAAVKTVSCMCCGLWIFFFFLLFSVFAPQKLNNPPPVCLVLDPAAT